MSTISLSFTCCSQCGTKLHATFFCHECGHPSCCLDCYCRHQANHAGKQKAIQAEYQIEELPAHLELAR